MSKMDRRKFLKTSLIAGAGISAFGTISKMNSAFAQSNETPSQDDYFIGKKRVAIFGAGVAGLTTAHELLERGFQVSLYESRAVGGKARSIYIPQTGQKGRPDLPGEHGFRFFPGAYNNLPEIMRRIPFGMNKNGVLDNLVAAQELMISRQGKSDLVLPTVKPWQMTEDGFKEVIQFLGDKFGCKKGEISYFVERIFVYATSCDARRFGEFENETWWNFIGADQRSAEYQKFLAVGLTRSLQALKAEETSARTVGWYVLALMMGFMGMTGNVDQVLNGPTSEMWINPWLQHLQNLGLNYYGNAKLHSLHLGNHDFIEGATVEIEGKMSSLEADYYVSALPLDVMRDQIFPQSPDLFFAKDAQNLCELGFDSMNGIQFYFDREIKMPKGHTLFMDSPWCLTAISQAQFWENKSPTLYGDGTVKGILSVDISAWDKPGILFGKKANQCTAEEVEKEVMAQILASLDSQYQQSITSAKLLHSFIDTGVKFSNNGKGKFESNADPLFINRAGTWKLRPDTRSQIPNLFYGCGYTKTTYDIDCMESACEAGKKAARAICSLSGDSHSAIRVYGHSEPVIFEVAKARDYLRYRSGYKNIHDHS